MYYIYYKTLKKFIKKNLKFFWKWRAKSGLATIYYTCIMYLFIFFYKIRLTQQ